MPVTRKLPELPPTSVPVIDQRTGQMNEAWRRFFVELMRTLAEMRDLIP